MAYTLDGATHNNPQDNGYVSIPFPDALQEFKVETSATSAQNGMKSAGSVNLTKSGTNEIHGNLFEFVRNGKFNARNAFATRRDTIKRNQFGGTLGGPIAKNKLFFFGGYQGTTVRQDPSDVISFVPTSAILSGDFTVFASPACNAGRQITLRAPFVNNRVDPALFSKPAVVLANKLPKTSDPCGSTLGNTGRGSIRGPGTWQFDAALTRTFQLRETQKLEFRAEAFNITNSFRMISPTTVLNSNTFGQVTAALDPRIMQFALKYFF